MKLHSIDTGFFKLDGGAMFGVVPKKLWQRTNPSDENNLCTWALRLLLVEEGDRKILIDTGIGKKQNEKFLGHYDIHREDSIGNSLEKIGLSMDTITDILLTHLHFDHCGGAVKLNSDNELVPTFPNATYWVSEEQWEWATNPNSREKASFLPENIQPLKEHGVLKFVKDNDQFTDNIQIFLTHGHTAGQINPIITYKDKKIVYMADFLPSIGHIPLPFVMGYDTRPLLTMEEKKKFLDIAAKENYILFLEHDPINECCTVKLGKKYVELESAFTLKSIL